MTIYQTMCDSPLGSMLLLADGEALTGVYFAHQKYFPAAEMDRPDGAALPIMRETVRQLTEYFHDGRTEFSLALHPAGTLFQQRVWAELRRIPYGVTKSYGELAEEVGGANMSRAVGAANGRNPISVIVPCHRVVGSNGTLTGYAGGLDRKLALLSLEKAPLQTSSNLAFDFV